jgi:hypothetical protein
MICLVQIPQRYMTVNNLSPLNAAIRLLPFGALVPIGSSISAAVMGQLRIPPVVVILLGAVLQLSGATLLSNVPADAYIHSQQYGFQVLLGLGVGFVTCGLIIMVPLAMRKQDLGKLHRKHRNCSTTSLTTTAVGTASIAQFRTLGGLVGISIATSISTVYLRNHLSDVVSPKLALIVLERTDHIHSLPQQVGDAVKTVFARSFGLHMYVVIAFSVAQIPVTVIMWTMKLVNSPSR